MTVTPEEILADLQATPENTATYTPRQSIARMDAEDVRDDLTGVDEPTTVLGNVVDFMQRGQYAAAGFASEVLTSKMMTNPVAALTNGVKEFASELWNPQERRSFSDVIRQVNPKFAEEHKWTTTVAGFIGDIALDPTTYLTLGAGAGSKVTIKAGLGAAFKEGSQKVLSKKGLLQRGKLVSEEMGRKAFISPELEKAKVTIASEIMHKGVPKDDAMIWASKRLETVAKKMDKDPGELLLLNQDFKLKLTGAEFKDSVFEGFVAAEGRAEQKLTHFVHEALLRGDTSMIKAGGLKFAGKQIIPEGALSSITDALGFGKVKDILSDTTLGKALRVGFNRFPKEIPKELKSIERRLYQQISEGERKVKTGLVKLFGKGSAGLDSVSRTRVGVLMAHFDDLETRMLNEAKSQRANLKAVTGGATAELSEHEAKIAVGKKIERILGSESEQMEIFRRYASAGDDDLAFNVTRHFRSKQDKIRFTQGGLSAAENSMLVQFKQEMKALGALEVKGKILKGMKEWYSPRYYDAIRDPSFVTTRFSKLRAGLSAAFGPDETRTFKTLSEAKDQGFDPIFDAAQLYALRTAAHTDALAKTEFNVALKIAVPELEVTLAKYSGKGLDSKNLTNELWSFGNKSVEMAAAALRKSGSSKDKDLATILEHVRFVGSPMYDPLDSKVKNDMLRMYDGTLKLFRASATVLRAAFGARNTVSNQFQMYLGGGMQGIKHLNVFMDPRSSLDSAMLLRGMSRPKLLEGMRNLKGAHGTVYSPQQIQQALIEHHIVRNVSFQGVDTHAPMNTVKGVRKLTKMMDRKRAVSMKLFKGSDGEAADGMSGLIAGSTNYWDFPAYLEDHARTTMFVNMMKEGHSAKAAAEFVEHSLFDYTHGMSQFETRVMRRIIPFYSFQRFAVPLLTKAMVNNPGRIPNALKTGKALMGAFGKFQRDEELTPGERAAIPNWLLSQPHEHAGFEGKMAKFNTFNNYSPLDVMGFIETDKNGGIDVAESVKNGALAQLAPIIKIPMEWALKRDFFTGRDFESARNAGDLDVDRLMGNLAQLVVNQSAERLGSPIGATFLAPAAEQMTRVMAGANPDAAKAILKGLLGYEEGVNRKGERTVYFAPYRYHMLTSMFPALNTAVQEARNDQNPLERTMRSLFGIPTIKRDLRDDARSKQWAVKKEVSDLKREYALAVRTKQEDRAKKAKAQLLQVLDHWGKTSARLASGIPDRGALAQGIDENGPITAEQILGDMQP